MSALAELPNGVTVLSRTAVTFLSVSLNSLFVTSTFLGITKDMFGYPFKLFGSINIMLSNKKLKETLDELSWIKKCYNKHYSIPKKKYDSDYDKKLRTVLKAVVQQINKDVEQASEQITLMKNGPGAPPKDRILLTKLHLMQVLFDFTNREMECFSIMFLLKGDDYFSYKTIERAYEDPVVAMILHNMFVLSAGEPREIDASGDGTGSALIISKHYKTDRLRDLKNKKDTTKRKQYVFSVAIVDLDTNLYVGFASGFVSEKQLFKQALTMLNTNGFTIKKMRLDKYYSHQSIFELFGNKTQLYLIPKSNATIRGNKKWKTMLKQFINNTMNFLAEYHKRSKSESNFSIDKRKHGLIRQKKPERIINTTFTRAIIHNYRQKHLHN